MRNLIILFIILGMILIVGSGCRPETTGAVTACISPEVQIGERCCIDFDENKICDDEQTLNQADEQPGQQTEEVKEPEQVAGPKTYTIEIKDFKYYPSELEIRKGDTVVWLNKEDSVPHAVFEINGRFRANRFMPGESFSFTFTEEGEYNFSDSYQTFMKGKVVVK